MTTPLYEQAIIEANELRKQAKQYGENIILEQFAPKINEAITAILENDDPFDDDEGDELGDTEETNDDLDSIDDIENGEDELSSEVVDDLPLAANEGLEQQPDEDEEIEIDLDSLMRTSDTELDGDPKPSSKPMYESEENLEESDDITEFLDEDLIESLKEIQEEMEMDFELSKPNGWSHTPQSVRDNQEDENIAALMSGDNKEKLKKKQKALDSLEEELQDKIEENSNLEKKLTSYKSKLKEFKSFALKQQEKLRSLSIMNSRLLYANKVLTNESLNGQQKNKIVESIFKAETPEAAKLIFETLQSSVGHRSSTGPKSRSEVACKSPQTFVAKPILESKQSASKSTVDDETKKRWQKIAGIIK